MQIGENRSLINFYSNSFIEMNARELIIVTTRRMISMIKRRTIKSVIFLDLKDNREQSGYVFSALIILSYVLVVLTFPLSLCFCLKVCILTKKNQ